jgi:hypothetical protein
MIPGKTNGLAAQALKEKYLQCFGVRTTCATALQQVVKRLVEQGVSRDLLVIWGVRDGYPTATVASVLSRIFCALGLRARRKGAGRKPSPDAFALLDHARRQYGERALKVVRAALRAGKAQATGDLPWEPSAASSNTASVTPKCQRLESNCSTAIKHGSKTAEFNRASPPSLAGGFFGDALHYGEKTEQQNSPPPAMTTNLHCVTSEVYSPQAFL